MNLFAQYGIKEVMDVTFYSTERIGAEIVYTPVLHFDTLKVSAINEKVEKTVQKGGKGIQKVLSWNYGRDISMQITDALITPASMSLLFGGLLENKISPFLSAITKLNIAKKYFDLNYSTLAFPSPTLTEEEWEIVFSATKEIIDSMPEENRPIFDSYIYKKHYYKRDVDEKNWVVLEGTIEKISSKILNIEDIGKITNLYEETDYIDQLEMAVVTNPQGIWISTKEQKKNLLKYYTNDMSSSYTLYLDAKTMLPLLNLAEDGTIVGWNETGNYDVDGDLKTDEDIFRLRKGTIYYKFSRTVNTESDSDTILGETLIIDSETFPEEYRIVGETYVRAQKDGKDTRCQITINRAKISPSVQVELKADGEPVVLDMDIDVLADENSSDMIEIKFFESEKDQINGGTYVSPQIKRINKTKVDIPTIEKVEIENTEIY